MPFVWDKLFVKYRKKAVGDKNKNVYGCVYSNRIGKLKQPTSS
jgi:hypothetical protein